MRPEYIEVTSAAQARFQMERGEVLVIPITGGTLYAEIKRGPLVYFHFQPRRGSSTRYTGPVDSIEGLMAGFQERGVRVYYCPGWRITERKNRVIDNAADKIRGRDSAKE